MLSPYIQSAFPAVGTYKDIGNVKDLGLYITHGIARMTPNIAATLIPGGIAGGVAKGLGVASKIGKAGCVAKGLR
jgi:hypothetical protein